MAKPVLHYVDGRGNAERIRFVLAGAGIDFDEHNLTSKEERLDLIASGKVIGGVVPMLSIDGLNVSQSWAIVRYLARHRGLEPESVEEQTTADVIFECIRDFETSANLGGYGWSDKQEHKEKFVTASAKWFPRFEALIKGPYLLGEKAYYCDYVLLNSLLFVDEVLPGTVDTYPKLATLRDTLVAMPNIKAFLASEKRKPQVNEEYIKLVRTVFF